MKFILTGVALTVAIVGISVAIDIQSRPSAQRPSADEQPRLICAPGRIEGTTQEIKLRPQLAGRIAKIAVKEGQYVKAGDVLLELDDAELVEEVAVAAAELHLAKAQLERLVNGAHTKLRAEAAALHQAKLTELERAKLTWKRDEELLHTSSVSRQEADNQRTLVAGLTAEAEAARAHLELLNSPAREDEVQIETARVEQAKARWKLAQVQLDRTRLRSPANGQVLKIVAELGELAGPASPDPTVIVADTSRGYVRAFVEEMDAREVRAGMSATITAEGRLGQEWHGRIVRLSPRMEDKTFRTDRPEEKLDSKTREVWIELDERPSVIGLRVDVVIDPGRS
jgi:multidrug resistance efflux pump